MVIGVVLLSATSCRGEPQPKVEQLPINPTPTRPGQLTVLAGNGENKDPVAGQYAVRTSLTPVGSVASAQDGSLFMPVSVQSSGSRKSARIARITSDGKVHLFGPTAPWHSANRLAVHKGKLWILLNSASPETSLSRYSLEGVPEETHFAISPKQAGDLTFFDDHGKKIPEPEQVKLRECWQVQESCQPVALGFGPDDTPIVATKAGDLYKATGKGEVRRWQPPGYSKVYRQLKKEITTEPGNPFSATPDLIITDSTGDIVILIGDAQVRLPRRGNASSTRLSGVTFPNGYAGVKWSGGFSGKQGQLIVTADYTYPGGSPLLRINSDGSALPINVDWAKECGPNTPPQLVGVARRPDGILAIGSKACRHVYAFRTL